LIDFTGFNTNRNQCLRNKFKLISLVQLVILELKRQVLVRYVLWIFTKNLSLLGENNESLPLSSFLSCTEIQSVKRK